ncbi:MAG: FtsW/RodA/SpoVE family cell cycle protein [Verrucomicrobiales bacterium]|nr:FtsW/RodA/SpoVE family cell cycle protein [Verrucomicrobiales bacterium]
MHKIHPMFRHPFIRLVATGIAGIIPFVLVLEQGDFGSAMVWIPVIAAMVLVGNIPFRYLITIVLVGTMFLPYAYFFGLKEYQKKRITVQFDMLMGKKVDILNEGYSAHHNLLAIGSGGWAGKGFANPKTVNNMGFISNETAINDFVFAVLAEEHGFRGALLMLSAFMVLLLLCLFVAFYSRDMLGRLITVGVLTLILAHIFQNVGMNLLIMPITGIPLPLISYGGTFAVIIMSLLGLVQSVWIHRVEVEEEEDPHSELDIDQLDS